MIVQRLSSLLALGKLSQREEYQPPAITEVAMTYETGLSVEKVEEKVASLFQPDTLIPAQYLETFRRKGHLEPEKRLMLAVLEDAVACFQKYVFAREARGKAIFEEAEKWILEENSEWPFSFENICEVLGINPQYVRQGLIRWKQMILARRPRAKIYRLTPRTEKNKGSVSVANRTRQSRLNPVDPYFGLRLPATTQGWVEVHRTSACPFHNPRC